MFSSNVAEVVRSFENSTLQLDPHPICPCSRISIALPDFYLTKAIESILMFSNTSKQYQFAVRRHEINRNQGIISIYAHQSESGEKVNSVFLKTLKKAICNFSETLSQSWVPYKNVCDDPFTGIDNVNEYEVAISKKATEGTYALYSHLIGNKPYRVDLGNSCSFSNNDDGLDIIAGSKKDVDAFLDDLCVIGKSIQKELAIEQLWVKTGN